MRRFADTWLAAWSNLADHKLRTLLTTLGMMFGVGAVIAMLSIGAGAKREALAAIDRLGTQNVVIRNKEFPADKLKEIRAKSIGLSQRDAQAIVEAVPGVAFVAPLLNIDPFAVRSEHNAAKPKVVGVGARHAEVTSYALAEGRFFDEADEKNHAQVCVLGAHLRWELFPGAPAVGHDVKVNDVWCEVIGVLAATQGDAATNNTLLLPLTTALRKFERDPLKSPMDELVVRVSDRGDAESAATLMEALLERLHAGVVDYEVVVPAALLKHSEETQRLFSLVMGLIAGISLLVGGIGIMNIMLASVLEQTKEIGIRRAVGARRSDIRFQFLTTAFALACVGGVLGVAVGVVIAKVVAAYAAWPTIVTLSSVILSLGVSLAVGVVSGLYPAERAARLDPIAALHTE